MTVDTIKSWVELGIIAGGFLAWFIRLEYKTNEHESKFLDLEKQIADYAQNTQRDREIFTQVAKDIAVIKTNLDWVLPYFKDLVGGKLDSKP